ncbi:GntR family transcriptional regulator [Vibrio sp. SS-MA-C1-2]|uniref:GntR family transcriptional regulator n=1 Tax=Vibrio sp. SS-MA-C1-2 TaxID=2908646 RepID=UPI001F340008|nr:GntR family transcriptional regulator [Vibrio sp. SS-MA-C1-2]UJF18503.1 GntR family transcriptional regulator [Vibrio sp. SS-MA-C1-2]
MYLYQKIAAQIHQIILERTPNEKLPDERTLAEMLSVSRSTIRKAIFELKERGLLHIKQGDGIYVKNGDLVQNLNAGFYSLTNDMKSIGKTIETKIIDTDKISITGFDELSQFTCPTVYKIIRTRTINGNKGIYELNYLASDVLPNFLDKINNNSSLYDIITQDYQLYFDDGEELLSVVIGNAGAEQILSLPTGSPLVRVERTVNINNTLFEKSISFIKPELFSWRYELKGKKPLF